MLYGGRREAHFARQRAHASIFRLLIIRTLRCLRGFHIAASFSNAET
jgi:hypothetical protein